MLSPNESAIFMLIFISLVAIVGSIYFYYQDKKEEKKINSTTVSGYISIPWCYFYPISQTQTFF